MFRFQKEYTFEKRSSEAIRVRERFPDRVLVIVETNNNLPPLDKNKYLVPNDFTVGQFITVLRKKIDISPDKAIYFFVNNTVPSVTKLMSQLDQQFRSSDGYLYIKLEDENTFGLVI